MKKALAVATGFLLFTVASGSCHRTVEPTDSSFSNILIGMSPDEVKFAINQELYLNPTGVEYSADETFGKRPRIKLKSRVLYFDVDGVQKEVVFCFGDDEKLVEIQCIDRAPGTISEEAIQRTDAFYKDQYERFQTR